VTDLQDLLVKTSRTFAMSIPLLPEPTCSEVRLAYLLFRIADTFEDSTVWSRERRIQALERFVALLAAPDAGEAQRLARTWTDDPPVDHDGYLELLAEFPAVMEAFWELEEDARELVREHTARTAEGMAGFVHRMDDDACLLLEDVDDLRRYCYVVAGIVGEMLTELFLLHSPALEDSASFLRSRARAFGEGLQLVNILKDSATDRVEGRRYLPKGVERNEIFELARGDLREAATYVQALQDGGAPRGVVEFCALPVLLAFATLERVEEEGPGAKITRPEVFSIAQAMTETLDGDQPLFPALRQSPSPTADA
jgi:farnesyl-diphosphate farnesyltransferase